jgi:hypothetical protein
MRRSERRLELFFVAAVTFHRDMDILVLLLIFVTLLAGRGEVRTDQGESGLRMSLRHIWDKPCLRRVAAFAGETEFSPVNVLMTALALHSFSRKPKCRMARTARHRCVLSIEWESC